MKSIFELPTFEKSSEEILKSSQALIASSKNRLSQIGTQSQPNFDTSFKALDDLDWLEDCISNRIYLLQNVSPSEEIRKAAEEAIMKIQDWGIEKAYDPKVYQACKLAEAENLRSLSSEEAKLVKETMRDFVRLGLDLPQEKQAELKELQKKLAQLETAFSSAINEYHDELEVSASDLEGLDEKFISSLPRASDGRLKVSLQYPEYLPVMEHAKSELIRRELYIKKLNTARHENSSRLQEMVQLRQEIAGLLGYPSWNHFIIEERMAKTPERVFHFLDDFEKRLRPKAENELKELKKLKAQETSQDLAEIHSWDYYYYASLYKKLHYEVDTKALREFFPLESVLQGFFRLIEKLFALKIEELKPGSFPSWHESVRLIQVRDKNDEILGACYLDLFPRKGKYGHAAAFSLIEGKLRPDGLYQRPVKAMVCNFSADAPHLLSHSEVETLFHEFGHIFHGLLTRAEFARFSGTSVAWDFVEAPSQIMENWAWDYEVLQTLASHYQDPSKQLSRELVGKMNEAHKAGMGLFYLRQLSFAKADLRVHGPGRKDHVMEMIQETISQVFLPLPSDTAFGAGFGHMVGYASGYYGYAWADVIAADMFSLFKKAGLLNAELGIRLRKEIFESGGARDENQSLEAFLKRPLSYDAFFEGLGV